MPVLVDTNVLVDLAVSDREWAEWSRTALGPVPWSCTSSTITLPHCP